MALFFKTFRHCDLSDKMGIPIFPLSRNERKHQAKYDDDESTLSEGSPSLEALMCRFRMLDDNRQHRKSLLVRPTDLNCAHSSDTEKRSNLRFSDVSRIIRNSIVASKKMPSIVKRTKSDVDEVTSCLNLALTDAIFDNNAFHRYESGILKPRHKRNSDDAANLRDKLTKHKSAALMKVAVDPMEITDETKSNLGKVHYHLACLHGRDRFPEIVPNDCIDNDSPSHDVFSVIFHLSHAASLGNVPACLALARARVGLHSSASPLLHANVPIDFDSAKDLCRRAMASERSPALPKAAAGCLLYQILEDEETAGNVEKLTVLEETLNFLNLAEREQASVKEHAKNMQSRGKSDGFRIGDIVEGNYFMEGTYYSARVIGVLDGGESVVIQYDDDGSSETLTTENVRSIELVSAEVLSHETSRLSDEEAFGVVNTDEIVLLDYELMSKIGDLKEKTGDRQAASELFQQAAELAMNAGKMQTANNWSMRAAELES